MRRIPVIARSGMALPVAIMAIVFLAAIPASLFGIATLEARARANEAASLRAQELAEAGLAHALGLLNGPMNQVSTGSILLGANGVWNSGSDDDGLLLDNASTGWLQIGPGAGIPSSGSARLSGGKYYVRVIDDPLEDPNASNSNIGGAVWGGTAAPILPLDANGRVMVQCLGETHDGARAIASAIVDGRRATTGILVDGNLSISSAVNISGACGTVHANGSISSTSSSKSSASKWSTAVSFSGDLTKLGGTLEKTAIVPIPDLSPTELCTRLTPQTGVTVETITPTGGTWSVASNKVDNNKIYCVNGNVLITKGGSAGRADVPLRTTILAAGSVSIEEVVHLQSATREGYTIVSGGDLLYSKYSGAGTLWGTAYCRSQLELNADVNAGNTALNQWGQFVCLSRANTGQTMPADWVNRSGATTSILNSRADLIFNCVSAVKAGVLRTATFASFQN